MIRLRNFFIAGLLLLVPIVATVWILKFMLGVLDDFSQPMLRLYIGREIPGAGALLTAVLILFLGSFSSFFAGQRIFEWFEDLVARVPIVRGVYSTTRQVVRGFSSSEGMNFKRAVMVPRDEGCLTIGFVTREFVMKDGDEGRSMTAVYVPTNHLYLGDVLVYPTELVLNLDLTLEEGISAVLSCGGSMREEVGVVTARDLLDNARGPEQAPEKVEASR